MVKLFKQYKDTLLIVHDRQLMLLIKHCLYAKRNMQYFVILYISKRLLQAKSLILSH